MDPPPSQQHKPTGEKESVEFRILLSGGESLFAQEVSRGDRNPGDFVIVVVHGGPGLADHTESFSGLKRALDLCQWENGVGGVGVVFFYDQLGCGQSDKPQGNADRYYSLGYYTDELCQVVRFVEDRHRGHPLCLLGHSWGGQVVLELLLDQHRRKKASNQTNVSCTAVLSDATAPTICCAIISNSPLDEGTYERKQSYLRSLLDEDMKAFYEQDEAIAIADGSVGSLIYKKLIGTSDTQITGEMKGWSALSRLGQLQTPCLFISGTDDTIPFEEYRDAAKMAGHCNAVILEGGGHGPFFGDTAEEYFSAITDFLRSRLVCKDTT